MKRRSIFLFTLVPLAIGAAGWILVCEIATEKGNIILRILSQILAAIIFASIIINIIKSCSDDKYDGDENEADEADED